MTTLFVEKMFALFIYHPGNTAARCWYQFLAQSWSRKMSPNIKLTLC